MNDVTGWAGMEPENAARLSELLATELPEVFKANRIIEQRTGYISDAGRNNLVDALSHVGTLAQRGSELSPRQQASQVAKIEEHLRRSMMETPEEVVRDRISDIAELWAEYQREAGPYRRAGTLRGVPRHDELEVQRKRIDSLMESARSSKPDETSWDEWREAASCMTEAADAAGQLADKLEQCIGEAKRMHREDERDRVSRTRWIVGILVGIAIAVGSYLLGQSGSDDEKKPSTSQERGPNAR